jgi:hypothetical protein
LRFFQFFFHVVINRPTPSSELLDEMVKTDQGEVQGEGDQRKI